MTKLSTIRQVSVNARDVARATAFYRDALGVKHLFDAGPGLSFFDAGGVRLMVSAASEAEFDHASSILYFDVPDIRAAHADLKARGVHFRDEPHLVAKLPDREVWMCFFDDSEGNVLAITSEVAAR
ncbi:MAG TPA: VOC family protein [Usitatibacter sp.]|nr:VOC family protein [Usitatibacter sp.]